MNCNENLLHWILSWEFLYFLREAAGDLIVSWARPPLHNDQKNSSTLQIWLKFTCGLKLVCGPKSDCSGYLFTPINMNLPAMFVSISEFVQRDQSKT